MTRSIMTSKTRFARFALPLFVAAGLSACAPSFKADVSRFQSQLPAPPGQTFAVVADDPGLAGGLEFALYADLVSKQMEELGYTRAASPETASLLVRFDYDVDNGRERVRTTDPGFVDPFFGPWGRFGGFGIGRGWAFGFHDPFLLRGPEVRSFTVYTSGIEMKIDSAAGQRLFEGKAQAVSRTNRLPTLVPNLVEALLTDYPGTSGETLRITIKDDEKVVRNVE